MPEHPEPDLRVPTAAGVAVAVHHLAEGDLPLLICHATGFHGRCYRVLAEHLAGAFDVWALDFRGHGSTAAPGDGDFGWHHMAEEVVAVVDALGGAPMRLVGHSLGGSSVVAAQMSHPGVAERAYLFEPVFFPATHLDERGENPMSGPARNRRAVFESRQAAIERYGSRPPLDALHPDALADYVEFGFVDVDEGVRLACEPEHEARVFEAEAAWNIDQLRGTSLPGVIAYGTTEVFGPGMLAPQIHQALDGPTLVHHPDLGHFGPLQEPERIAVDIAAALR